MQIFGLAPHQRKQTPVFASFGIELFPGLQKMLVYKPDDREAIADNLGVRKILPDQMPIMDSKEYYTPDEIRDFLENISNENAELLMKMANKRWWLCNRSELRTLMAVRILSFSMDIESETEPPLIYERDSSQSNAMKRPYRIYLRSR